MVRADAWDRTRDLSIFNRALYRLSYNGEAPQERDGPPRGTVTWLRSPDSNRGPSGYEPDELTDLLHSATKGAHPRLRSPAGELPPPPKAGMGLCARLDLNQRPRSYQDRALTGLSYTRERAGDGDRTRQFSWLEARCPSIEASPAKQRLTRRRRQPLAESEGFEPPWVSPRTVFETGAIGRALPTLQGRKARGSNPPGTVGPIPGFQPGSSPTRVPSLRLPRLDSNQQSRLNRALVCR